MEPHLISSAVYIPKDTPTSRRHGTTLGGFMANEHLFPGRQLLPLSRWKRRATGGTTRSGLRGGGAGRYHRRGGAVPASPPLEEWCRPPSQRAACGSSMAAARRVGAGCWQRALWLGRPCRLTGGRESYR